ncbi:MAG: ORF6N domain-containing protein [Actinomycetota bacterium]
MNKEITSVELKSIAGMVHFIRDQRVMLSMDLAELYGVETKVLMQAVKRNIDRFPPDFMFQLNDEEYSILKSQFVTSSWGGARRANPYAFTEQGIAMLSGILNSPRAVAVNIAIMRAFVQMRRVLEQNAELLSKIDDLEHKYSDHDEKIHVIFAAIRELMTPPETPRRPIGFGENAQ